MSTRETVREAVEQVLNDTGNATWAAAEINIYVEMAIREYSAWWPYLQSTTSVGTGAKVAFDLPAGFVREHRVLLGSTVQVRLDEEDAHFGVGFYDVRNQLIVGANASSATLTLVYWGTHTVPDDDVDVLTVPDRDLELLVRYCVWQCLRRLEADEAILPELFTSVLSWLQGTSEKAYTEYMDGLTERLKRWPATAVWPPT